MMLERAASGILGGAIAASVTPLRQNGAELDGDAFEPVVDHLVAGGMSGMLALGTTGEGIMLTARERRHASQIFVDAAAGRLAVAVHCGAQTTAETVELASHAAEIGADAVAVIGPPYFPLDAEALYRHFHAAALACAPLPFYVYEFASRSGYAVPIDVISRLRDNVPNLAGLKVSDTPFERLEPYLLTGLDVLVGSERLIVPALRHGAVGAVSGLAASFPELVSRLVRFPGDEDGEHVGMLRERVQEFPFHAALKTILGWRGLPVLPDVRSPLRGLTPSEGHDLRRIFEGIALRDLEEGENDGA